MKVVLEKVVHHMKVVLEKVVHQKVHHQMAMKKVLVRRTWKYPKWTMTTITAMMRIGTQSPMSQKILQMKLQTKRNKLDSQAEDVIKKHPVRIFGRGVFFYNSSPD